MLYQETPQPSLGPGLGAGDTSMLANMGYDESHPPATTPGALSEKGQATPYHEDYEMPVSVGPAEEQVTRTNKAL